MWGLGFKEMQDEALTLTQPSRNISDSDLLHAARSGDTDAFQALWQRHSPPAVNYIRRLAGSDAEDVISEAFAEIWDQIQRGSGPTQNFTGYLYTTARNIAAKTYREHQRNLTNLEVEGTPVSSPIEQVVEDESSVDIIRAFKSLPDRWQQVLWLTEVEEVGRGQIAAQLGLKPNAVSALSKRAVEGLRLNWLRQQLPSSTSVTHGAVVDLLPRYARGKLSKREQADLSKHLEACSECNALYVSVVEQDSRLGRKRTLVGLLVAATVVPTVFSGHADTAAQAADFPTGALESAPAGSSHSEAGTRVNTSLGRTRRTKTMLIAAVILVACLFALYALSLERGNAPSPPATPVEQSGSPESLEAVEDLGDTSSPENELPDQDGNGKENESGSPGPSPSAPFVISDEDGETPSAPAVADDETPPSGQDGPATAQFSVVATESYGGAIAPILSGTAESGAPVTIAIGDKTFATTSLTNGRWSYDLAQINLPAGPTEVAISSTIEGAMITKHYNFDLLAPRASAQLSADPASLPQTRRSDLKLIVEGSNIKETVSVCVHTPEPMTWRFQLGANGTYQTTYYSWRHETLDVSFCRGSRSGPSVELVPANP